MNRVTSVEEKIPLPIRLAVIGHIAAAPTTIQIHDDPKQRELLLGLHKYTRVLTDGDKLVDHIAYLKKMLGVPRQDEFSVWEMKLCASLLLQSHLGRNGVDVVHVNYLDSDNVDKEFRSLQDFGPQVVVLSTTFVLSGRHLSDAGQLIRKHLPEAFLVAGGHHIFTTLMYMNDQEKRDYLLSSGCDAFVNDVQGESTILELCNAWPNKLSEVSNLIWKNEDGQVAINSRAIEDNDINDTLIDFKGIEEGAIVHLRTARSCSFKCAFCSYPTIAGELALMDLDNVMATLRSAKDSGAGAVFFVDDTFNVPRPRFEKLLDRMIEAGLDLPWYSFLRGQFVDEKLVEKMSRSGCQGVFLGIESGSDEILQNMNKGSATEFYAPSIRWLKDQGIMTVGAFIVGYPGETPQTVSATAEFIENSRLDFYFLQPFYYLHHTPVHKVADKYKLTGSGLRWSHATMNAHEACTLLDQLFLDISGPVAVNPDYTLWEIAYLLGKGLTMDRILDYRNTINQMTASQVVEAGAVVGGVTSRSR